MSSIESGGSSTDRFLVGLAARFFILLIDDSISVFFVCSFVISFDCSPINSFCCTVLTGGGWHCIWWRGETVVFGEDLRLDGREKGGGGMSGEDIDGRVWFDAVGEFDVLFDELWDDDINDDIKDTFFFLEKILEFFGDIRGEVKVEAGLEEEGEGDGELETEIGKVGIFIFIFIFIFLGTATGTATGTGSGTGTIIGIGFSMGGEQFDEIADDTGRESKGIKGEEERDGSRVQCGEELGIISVSISLLLLIDEDDDISLIEHIPCLNGLCGDTVGDECRDIAGEIDWNKLEIKVWAGDLGDG